MPKVSRVLVVAIDLNPMLGSESGAASLWVKVLSKRYALDVVTDEKHRAGIEREDYGESTFHYVDLCDGVTGFLRRRRLYLHVYRRMLAKGGAMIRGLLAGGDHAMVHCLTPAGIYAYSDLYKHGVPLLVGPVGGGLRLPPGFEALAGSRSVRARLRDLYYSRITRRPEWLAYYRAAERVLIGTPHLLRYLPQEMHSRAQVLFDCFVDAAAFEPKPLQRTDTISLCCMGRLESNKGQELLVEAMRRVLRSRRDVFATIVGDGSARRALERRISEAGIGSHVKLMGSLPHGEALRVLAGSDMFCLPTLREPGGAAILEAMAYGVPVITSDYGGPAYSVTRECGIKIKPAGYEDYVVRLEEAIRYLADRPGERARMGANARTRVLEHFSVEAFEAQIFRVYESIIG